MSDVASAPPVAPPTSTLLSSPTGDAAAAAMAERIVEPMVNRMAADFARDGYAIWSGFWCAEVVERARRRSVELLDAVDAQAPAGVFSTLNHQHAQTDWFLGSGDTVRPFFEEEAVDAQGRLLRPAAQAVNKFGHALHRLDPVFADLAADPRLAALARALGQREPEWRQSMLIVKQPGIGGEVRWHQDATYLYSEPVSVLAFWWALEDAAVDNGCLWVEPGGHHGPLRERFICERLGDQHSGRPLEPPSTRHVPLDATPWPERTQARPLPVAAGSLVVMHGLLPHRSDANRSPRSRLALSLHAVDRATPYAADNWLQAAGTPLALELP
jgi:phytanoyl-CoA hydroxylase